MDFLVNPLELTENTGNDWLQGNCAKTKITICLQLRHLFAVVTSLMFRCRVTFGHKL